MGADGSEGEIALAPSRGGQSICALGGHSTGMGGRRFGAATGTPKRVVPQETPLDTAAEMVAELCFTLQGQK